MKKSIGNVSQFPTLKSLFEESKKNRVKIQKDAETGHMNEAFLELDQENDNFWTGFIGEMIKLGLVPAGDHRSATDNIDLDNQSGDIVWNQREDQSPSEDEAFEQLIAALSQAA